MSTTNDFKPEKVLEKLITNGVVMCKVQGRDFGGVKTIWMKGSELENLISHLARSITQLWDSFNAIPLTTPSPNTEFSVAKDSHGKVQFSNLSGNLGHNNNSNFSRQMNVIDLTQRETIAARCSTVPMGSAFTHPSLQGASHSCASAPNYISQPGYPYPIPQLPGAAMHPSQIVAPNSNWRAPVVKFQPLSPNSASETFLSQKSHRNYLDFRKECLYSRGSLTTQNNASLNVVNPRVLTASSASTPSSFLDYGPVKKSEPSREFILPKDNQARSSTVKTLKPNPQIALERVHNLLEKIKDSSFTDFVVPEIDKDKIMRFLISNSKEECAYKSSFDCILNFLKIADEESRSICLRFLKLFLFSGVILNPENFIIYVQNFNSQLLPRVKEVKEVKVDVLIWGKPCIEISQSSTARFKPLKGAKIKFVDKKVAPNGTVTYTYEENNYRKTTSNLRDLSLLYPLLEDFEHKALKKRA